MKLCPQLDERKFITVNINGKAQANPNLLAFFAYVVSLFLEGLNPAEFEFEENDFMIDHFNKCMKSSDFSTINFINKII